MTSYAAYDAGLPCKNPSCKSHGKPHPNCRCWPGMAKGGEAAFCSSDRAHDPKCEYFAEGGTAIDPDSVSVDQPAAEIDPDSVKSDAPEEIDPENVTVDSGDESNADLSPADLQAKMVKAAHPDGVGKYETPLQQIATVAEGGAEGFAPIVAAGVERGAQSLGVPGMSEEDREGRAKANPNEHMASMIGGTVAALATGVGEAGLIAEGIGAVAKKALPEAAPVLAKVGANVIKGAIINGLIQGDDEIAKGILGQGDPQAPVAAALAHMGAAGLVGAGGGVLASVAEAATSSLQKLSDAKFGKKIGTSISSFATGFGQASEESNAALRTNLGETGNALGTSTEMDMKAYKAGQKYFDNITKIAGGGGILGAYEGYKKDGLKGAAKEGLQGWALGYVFGKAGQYAAPAVIRIMSNGNVQNALGALDHADLVSKGAQAISKGVGNLFTAGSSQAINAASTKDLKDIREWIMNGGATSQIRQSMYDQNTETPGYAEGGLVQEHHQAKPLKGFIQHNDSVAEHFPEQNIMLQAAKGRISQYLSALQPQKNQPKLAFDDHPDDREAHKTYDKALHIAASPLSVLDHVKAGTLEPDHVKHLNGMFPELTNHLTRKLTEHITQAQLDDNKPTYKVRQGLSMMLGTPLSGELTPANIQAAQAVYAPKQAPDAQQPSSGKKGSSSLSKVATDYRTPDQARQARQDKI